MDSIKNPFSPNAGARPPELVGRDEVLEQARVLMGRTQLRRSAQSLLLTGLRGVGKTVVLNEILNRAEEMGNILPIYLEASENRSLGELLAAPLKIALLKLNRVEGAKQAARRGLSVLRNFMGTIKISLGDVGIELEPCTGIGDSGDMQYDLKELLSAVAEAALERDKAVILLIDEVQYLSQEELESLVMSLHHMQQRQLPLAMVGAGLPILAKLAGEAKSYAERLFKYPVLGALSEENSRKAMCKPFGDAGIDIDEAAVELVLKETGGYPYFIQEWCSQLWNFIEKQPVVEADVQKVKSLVLYSLDENFFRVRMERITPSERKLLYAMAEVMEGEHPCRIGDVAGSMGIDQKAIGPRRNALIKKGMIYSPGHGLIAFTVPMFSGFLKRNPQ